MTSQNTVLSTPFPGGRTVRDIVEHSPALVSEAWCRQILQQVLQSLEQQYASNAPHRIISPDNVAVLENGDALLLPSPDGLASSEVDAADDIHALALVMHYAISAESPPEGPLGPRLYDHYSDALTQTIDRCLGPNLRLRPKTIPELRAMLGLEAGAGVAVLAEAAAAEAAPPIAAEPAAQEAAFDAPLELSKAEAHETVTPLAQSAFIERPAPVPAPVPVAPAIKPAQPIAATPLKPSSHAPSPAAAPAASPARPKPAVRPLATPRHKSGVERWAMIAGAAVVLLAAGSALYAHLSQDNSDDLVAVSTPQDGASQAPAAQGLDAGEAVVTPATPDASEPAAEATASTPPGSADTAVLPGTTAGNGAARSTAVATPADAVINGTTYKLLIKPWGTVYVNDVDRGVSPPVKRLTLGQGQHTIRIVNPNFAEHVMTVNAGSAESATIEHDFTAQAEGGR